jgi:hypothetical protein
MNVLIVLLLVPTARAAEPAVAATLQKLVASGEIPPAIAVVLDMSTERPNDIANRAQFEIIIAGFSVGGLTAAYVAHRHPMYSAMCSRRAVHSGVAMRARMIRRNG